MMCSFVPGADCPYEDLLDDGVMDCEECSVLTKGEF